MSKSKDKKNNDNELLSFEELKNKVNHETAKDEKPDSEINDLLSALGDELKDKSQPEPNNAAGRNRAVSHRKSGAAKLKCEVKRRKRKEKRGYR